jgi:hypothetical protein
VAARAADPPPGQAPQELGLGDVEVDDRVEGLAEVLQQTCERLGLGDGARKAVEDEAPGAAQPLGHHPDDDIVGHQRALVHVTLGLEPKCCPRRQGLAEHVAGRQVEGTPLPREIARLRALARPGRPQKRHPHAQLRANAPERDLDFFKKPS